MKKCPKCGSKHIHQTSRETIEYCLKNNKTVKNKWDSEYQSYECQDCGFTKGFLGISEPADVEDFKTHLLSAKKQ